MKYLLLLIPIAFVIHQGQKQTDRTIKLIQFQAHSFADLTEDMVAVSRYIRGDIDHLNVGCHGHLTE